MYKHTNVLLFSALVSKLFTLGPTQIYFGKFATNMTYFGPQYLGYICKIKIFKIFGKLTPFLGKTYLKLETIFHEK